MESSPKLEPALPPQRFELYVPSKTLIKLLLTAAVVYGLGQLIPLFALLLLAVMAAVTIYPAFRWLARRGVPQWVSVTALVVGSCALSALLFYLVLPPLIGQVTSLSERLPELKDSLLGTLPNNPMIRNFVVKGLQNVSIPSPEVVVLPLVSVSQSAIGGVADLVLVFIFTIYLLVDGPRTTNWILAFFSEHRRLKLRATANEVSKIISAYVAGQVITSVICSVYTVVLLALLKVPAALMLGILAGIFDILPVLGFFLAAAPAVLLALTVSPVKALLVAIVYVVYHALENYILVPKIYGSSLRMTDFVVLISLVAASILGGMVGAIVILPLVASYPIIERIWLIDVLGRSVVIKHMEAAAAVHAKDGR